MPTIHLTLPLLAVALLLSPVSQLWANTEYFVSPHGSDNAAGTSAGTAFASVQHGVDLLQAGDTLTILPGEYVEAVRRSGLGSAAAETTLRAAIPGTVLLRGDRPVDGFELVAGESFVYVTDYTAPESGIHAVIEQDTRTILKPMPNAGELAFAPGLFYYDGAAGKLYISTSDWQPPATHRYTAAVIPTHGIHLSDAERVRIEGIAFTGFLASDQQPRQDQSMGSTWGLFINRPRDCVVISAIRSSSVR